MAENSSIEWTDATWNPTTGCTKISPGCAACYIDRTPPFRMAGRKFVKGRIPIEFHPDRLEKPLHWRKPRRVFVNSLSDLFHPDIPFEFIARVFAVMRGCPQHTFQVLTKRPERMAEFVAACRQCEHGWITHDGTNPERAYEGTGIIVGDPETWPLRNVWLGTSVENQATADVRIPHLLREPAAVRFLSCEPLLGPVDFRKVPGFNLAGSAGQELLRNFWVIVGGESGPKSRPCDVKWIRSIRDQCKAAGVPVFVKQLGANIVTRNDQVEDGFSSSETGWPDPCVEHHIYGFREDYQGADCRIHLRDKKGGDWSEWPNDLRVREFPALDRKGGE